MIGRPSPNGRNGRDRRGRFAAGNQGGPGNPNGRRSAEFRQRLFDIAEEHFDAIVKKLVDLALAGDRWAIEYLLDRLLGPVESWGMATGEVPTFGQHNYYTTLTPEQQARMDELAKIGLAKLALEDDGDAA